MKKLYIQWVKIRQERLDFIFKNNILFISTNYFYNDWKPAKNIEVIII